MLARLRPYIEIARIDHWFKNVFMALGILVALFYEPDTIAGIGWRLVVAVLATCLVASSNYVLNEVLDAATDRLHPTKRNRPVPAGRVHIPTALVEWLALAAAGFALAFTINVPFAGAAIALWIMGLIYNVRPIRAKELPYLDVITESINNPIRLLLGWFLLIPDKLPSISLLLSYWALGAFFMATKRLAELREIGDRAVAARYRRSFAFYTEERLLVSLLFYISACAFFGGVFIVRCKLELVLFVPVAAGHFAYYLALGLAPHSPVQNPEKLYKARGFLLYTLFAFAFFVALMFTRIPMLYDLFNFDAPKTPSLWVLEAWPRHGG